ncbi:MAG: S1 RNA-binding domain-containing protein [Candidatus Diapherotrites archaeon]|nr:S1 RNA-binding domain-containing protein [Candidatus Diapherotrites archaeon]
MEYPGLGEQVIVKVVKILDYGVIISLVDYPPLEGFVHISHVSSGWVKNIRNFVKDQQIRVAEVLAIDVEKNQMDLSFKKISSGEEKQRLEEWKQLKRSKVLIEILAKSKKKSFDSVWTEVAEPIIEHYESLPDGLKAIALEGETAASMVPKHWIADLVALVKKNIIIPVRMIKAVFTVKSMASDGVHIIKEGVGLAMAAVKTTNLEVHYMGAGKFAVKASGPDYKQTEKKLKQFQEVLEKELKRKQASVEFAKI